MSINTADPSGSGRPAVISSLAGSTVPLTSNDIATYGGCKGQQPAADLSLSFSDVSYTIPSGILERKEGKVILDSVRCVDMAIIGRVLDVWVFFWVHGLTS